MELHSQYHQPTPRIEMDTVTITTNYWRIPSPERAFDGWLEGAPTEQERRETIEAAIAARKAWQPSAEGLALVEQLKSFAGCMVRVQLWDASMWFHELDAPYPFDAVCIGVETHQIGEFLQAFLMLRDIIEEPNDLGYSPVPYFQKSEDEQYLRASLADLYSITKVGIVI